MFKKATSRQLLSVSGLFILVWQIALGQVQWKGNTYLPDLLPVRKIEKNKDTGVLGKMDDGQTLVYHTLSGEMGPSGVMPIVDPGPGSDESLSWPVSFQSFSSPPTKSFSSLEVVENATLVPWRTQVKLFITGAKGQRYTCSGTLIDGEHVMTAGHCVFSISKGGWAKEVEAVPAFEEGNAPYGTATMTEALVWEGWIKDKKYQDDVAILKLDRPLGAITGWLSYGYRSEDGFFRETSFDNPGYPASGPYNGQQLYNWRGSFDYTFGKELLYHKDEAYAGQSGSGAFYWKEKQTPVLLSVLSHGTPAPSPFTGHVRLSSQKFADIQFYIENARKPSLDLQPLFVQSDQVNYKEGENFDGCSFMIYNASRRDYNGVVSVAVELFDESGQSYEIGREEIGLPNFQGGLSREIKLSDLNWAWPADLSSGTYSLGVRLLIEDGHIENNLTGLPDQLSIQIQLGKKTDPVFLELSSTEIRVPATGHETLISLSTNPDQPWKIHCLVDWVELEPEQGKGTTAIRIKVKPYAGAIPRETHLMAIAGTVEKEIRIVQESDLKTDQIVLTPGWNLISLDVNPIDNRIAEVVKRLKPGNLIQVNGLEQGAYQFYRPSNPEAQNTLKVFRAGAGYWVQVKEADLLVVSGQPIEENLPIPLFKGRNLIGYIPASKQSPQEFFKEWIDQGRLKYVIGYENGKSLRFSPANPDGSTLKYLQNGMGYWVEMGPEVSALHSRPLADRNLLRSHLTPSKKGGQSVAYDIQHLPTDKSFLIHIHERVKGTLLLMISDTSGRLLKKQKLQIGEEGTRQLSVPYHGIRARQLVLSLILNDQYLDSRVYLND